MGKDKSNVESSGVSTTTVLQIIFLVLKLTHLINWSWFWVLSPTIFSIGGVALTIGGVAIYLKIKDLIEEKKNYEIILEREKVRSQELNLEREKAKEAKQNLKYEDVFGKTMNNNKKMNATSNSIKDEYYDQAYENNETIEGPVMSMRKRY